MGLQSLDVLGVLGQHKVNCVTLSAVTTRSANSVDVVLLLEWQLVVDHKTNLLHVNSSGEQVSSDQHARSTGTELLHDDVSLLLVHLTVHDRDCEVVFSHRLLELLNALLRVAIDEGLVDVQVRVQVEQYLDLPFLLLNGNVVLPDTFKGQFLILHKNLSWFPHKVLRHRQDFRGQRCREERCLDISGQELEDVLDLLLEAAREHLVGLVEHEQAQVVGLEEALLHEVVDTAWSSDNNLGTALFEEFDVFTDGSATDEELDANLLVLSDVLDDEGDLLGEFTSRRHDQRLHVVTVRVDTLERTDCEGTSFTGTGLSLKYGVFGELIKLTWAMVSLP